MMSLPTELSVQSLRAADPAARDAAVRDLHALLLRAARFELRRCGTVDDDLATQAANDALVAVLAKLDDFRGASRFSTWAYKFAILEAGVRVRRRAWQEREVTVDPEQWSRFADRGPSAHEALVGTETLAALRRGIEDALTPHQRLVFCALALGGVPIDVLADRMNTTRGALYKTLHDARKRLRAHLDDAGLGGAA